MHLMYNDIDWHILDVADSSMAIHSEYSVWDYKSYVANLGKVNHSSWINFVKRS